MFLRVVGWVERSDTHQFQRYCQRSIQLRGGVVSKRHFINAIASQSENAIEFATVIEGDFIKMP